MNPTMLEASRRSRPASYVKGACVALVAALTLSACGGDDSDSSSSSSSKSGSESGTFDLAAVKSTVENLFEGDGTFESPPTKAPKPEPGKKIWLISCGQALVTCSVPMAAAEEAAEAMGWETQIFDTKGDYTTTTAGFQRAIADKADGVYVFFIDCKYARNGLQMADKAGIPVVAAESGDCNETDEGAKPLFDYSSTYTGGIDGPYPGKEASFAEYIEDWGRVQAMAAIAATDGKANALVFNDNISFAGEIIANGMIDEYEKCTECEVKLVEFPIEELATGLRERTEQELLKNPKANVISAVYDNITVVGVAEAAAASGRDIYVTLGEGTAAGMEVLREGKAHVGAGLSLEWDSWHAMDTLNRMFNGEDPQPSGSGILLFDQERNLSESGDFEPPIDFRAVYTKAWNDAK